jgi:DNA polymerase-3 subunit delta'
VGKKTVATIFAMACNCTGKSRRYSSEGRESRAKNKDNAKSRAIPIKPCGSCTACRKIHSGNHPDIIHIGPSGSLIKIDQVRNLCNTLAMKPYEARFRIVILADAHAMNPAAGNALLKILEEPPERTILILTAGQAFDLLPTIVSRCQHIRFNPISRKNLTTMLVQKEGLKLEDASVIANLANGSFSKAISITKQMNRILWIDRRNWLITAGGLDYHASLVSRPINSLLAFAEALSKNRETLLDSLEVIKSWLRDLVVFKYYPDKIINKDLLDTIQSASKKNTIESILAKFEAVESAYKDIQANANLRLTLEKLVIRIASV